MEPLFLQPVFQERIWGGDALRTQFGYEIPSNRTGECWAISAHPNGPSTVMNGPYKGQTLDRLWKEQPQLFGHPKEDVFPLLTKILDANMDLSVQVHPDDAYAKEHENGELGKTECWYILDCKPGASLIYGHSAKTKEEFIQLMKDGNWDGLLNRVSIKPGDFFYVPSGTIHALCEGTLVLETQQSSDTTYRLYDYGRTDDQGNPRELHVDKSLEVATIPHKAEAPQATFEQRGHAKIMKYLESEFFSVYKWMISDCTPFAYDTYMLCSVIDGEGVLKKENEEYALKKGDHFILPNGFGEFTICGKVDIIASHV
ncbi:mannose-6-phosphate isomerase, class I [Bacillus sp. 1P06AnD]|uniref:mannose-6-phosphate isomerase, class I n=1 Tax=Bacillus sp. 1P06AnD TaxID=3132208 RepID=UPI0039A03125